MPYTKHKDGESGHVSSLPMGLRNWRFPDIGLFRKQQRAIPTTAAQAMRKRERARTRLSTRFTRKMHVAFATMLLITLTLAWYFYDSVKWYEFDVNRIALANEILYGYQSLSHQGFVLLNEINGRAGQTRVPDKQMGQADALVVRQTVAEIRQGLTADVVLAQGAGAAKKLQRLAEIERVIEEIIRVNDLSARAVLDGRVADATAEINQLQRDDVAALFQQLIGAEVDEQRSEVQLAHGKAINLAIYITGALPVFVVIMTVLTLFMIWFFSRSLTRSVSVLHEGAQAFKSGDLNYRIPELAETEFKRLGQAFNTMARELSGHRSKLHDDNVSLEAIVDERTRALKTSNEKLASIDDNRRKLLADISHEFRTPLTVIQGESEIALRGTKKTKNDYRDSLSRIMEQAIQTTRLVDDLLFIARADGGEPRLTVQQTAVVELLRKVCSDFSATAEQKDVTLHASYPNDDICLQADTGRLRQVFSILLDNALRYSNQAGTVEIAVTASENAITVTFSDQGIGLTEEEAQQVFQRFYRGSRATNREHGTGLGLPVAKAIIEAHHGQITLKGKPEGGTLATVILRPTGFGGED